MFLHTFLSELCPCGDPYFRKRADSEIVIHGHLMYETWGRADLARLEGRTCWSRRFSVNMSRRNLLECLHKCVYSGVRSDVVAQENLFTGYVFSVDSPVCM